jgi:hypothetical protein
MRLQDAYRLALAKGLTAKQAGAEFGLSYESISKIKNRYGFPSLVSEWEFQAREGIAKMKDEEIKSYIEVMLKKGHGEHKDLKYCQDELEKRTKQDPLYKEAVNSVKLSKKGKQS